VEAEKVRNVVYTITLKATEMKESGRNKNEYKLRTDKEAKPLSRLRESAVLAQGTEDTV
jgi:hypothetical protein